MLECILALSIVEEHDSMCTRNNILRPPLYEYAAITKPLLNFLLALDNWILSVRSLHYGNKSLFVSPWKKQVGKYHHLIPHIATDTINRVFHDLLMNVAVEVYEHATRRI